MRIKVSYFRPFKITLILLIVYKAVLFNHSISRFISNAPADTLNYSLHITENQMPLMKDTIFGREKCLITYCPVTLTNNSNYTLKYLTMNASWWDLYSLDNQNFKLAEDYWNVFKNGPKMITILPHQSNTQIISIITYKSYYRGQQVRIGFSLQRLGFEFPDLNIIPSQPMSKTTNLIWSNAVTIH